MSEIFWSCQAIQCWESKLYCNLWQWTHFCVKADSFSFSTIFFSWKINGIGSTFYFRQFVLNRKSKSFTGWLTEWEDKIGNRLQLLTQFCVKVRHSSYFFQWRVRGTNMWKPGILVWILQPMRLKAFPVLFQS